MNRSLLKSSCAVAAVLGLLGLAACADDDDDSYRTARYEAPQPSPDVSDAQTRLQTLGYYHGPVDGLWGPDTRDALRAFQHDHNLVETARLDGDTAALLRDASAPPPANVASSGVRDPLEPRVIRGVQVRLRQLGFYHGPADGVWGSGTQDAVSDFQKSRGLQATGALTPSTAAMMGLNPNDLRASTASYRR